jgi:hypothetical protein
VSPETLSLILDLLAQPDRNRPVLTGAGRRPTHASETTPDFYLVFGGPDSTKTLAVSRAPQGTTFRGVGAGRKLAPPTHIVS